MSGFAALMIALSVAYAWPGKVTRERDGTRTSWGYLPMWIVVMERLSAVKPAPGSDQSHGELSSPVANGAIEQPVA